MTIEVARANHDKLEGRVVGLERDQLIDRSRKDARP